MIWIYLFFITVLTLVGGLIPILYKKFHNGLIPLSLAFSGAFLFCITFLHLVPETFQELGEHAGLYIIAGFCLQLLLQKVSHGVEHGHTHDGYSHAVMPIFIGLAVHAFMEGIPLGFNYQVSDTLPSIVMGICAHKLPEAITLSVVLISAAHKNRAITLVVIFSLISPFSALLSMYYGEKFYFISSILVYIIPLVIGAFLHISTTILYESGTKHHELSKQKVSAMIIGLSAALLTTLIDYSH